MRDKRFIQQQASGAGESQAVQLYKRDHMGGEVLGTVSFKPCAVRNLLKNFYTSCVYTYFMLKTNILLKPETLCYKKYW